MGDTETINLIKLSMLPKLSSANAKILFEAFGSATDLFANLECIRDFLPDASDLLVETLSKHNEYTKRAEDEFAFSDRKNIRCLSMASTDYPSRLKDCDDAPILLYYLGNADLNQAHTISVVGTRHCSEYGKEICKTFLKQLKEQIPNILVVSGLAYGIDIEAHRNALTNGYDTVGVLAHGLDQIYPQRHRPTAIDMLKQGGLITEYPSHTNADKFNFVKRNRIIAGMTDVTIVIESKEKGGSLITADIAESYNRDVCAFPGRIFDEYSAGCNKLIHDNHATMITSADDLISLMRWKTTEQSKKPKVVQQELFPDLTDEEMLVIRSLKNVDSKQINQITVETNIPVNKVSVILFNLTIKGIVKMLNGGCYKLIP